MGYVSYEITLTLPGGKPTSGAKIVATNINAILPSSKTLHGNTNKDGYFKWDTLATGFNNDTYNFIAQKEHEGILYIAEWTDRVSPSEGHYSQDIEMRTQFFEELKKLEIPSLAIKGLQVEGHFEILALIRELSICISQKLPNASISLGTKILEGLIRIYLKRLDKWEDKMGKLTFGLLLDSLKGTDIEKNGLYNKLTGINSFRIPAVHFKDIDTTIDEARIGNSVIIQFLKLLYPHTKQD